MSHIMSTITSGNENVGDDNPSNQSSRFYSISTVVFVALISLPLLKYFIKCERKRERRRKMSWLTQAVATNSFPEELKPLDACINGILWFKSSPSIKKVAHVWKEKVLKSKKFDKFLSIPEKEEGEFTGYWKNVNTPENIDLSYHFEEITLNKSSQFNNFLSNNIMELQFDKSKPYWKIFFIKFALFEANLYGEDMKECIVVKYHHGYGDGLSAMELALDLLTLPNENKIKNVYEELKNRHKKQSLVIKIFSFIPKLFDSTFRIMKLLFGDKDSRTFLRNRNPFECGRKVSFLPPINLEEVKAMKLQISKKLNIKLTLNDVITSCLGGAIWKYLKAVDDPVVGIKNPIFRFQSPFAFPRDNSVSSLHNNFSLFSVNCQMKDCNIFERLIQVHKETQSMKNSYEVQMFAAISKLTSQIVSRKTYSQMAYDATASVSCVLTNVWGPETKVLFAGEPVSSIYYAVYHVTPIVSYFTYNGKIFPTFTFFSVTPKSEIIKDFFIEELNELRSSVE